jgi:hypothetical protein
MHTEVPRELFDDVVDEAFTFISWVRASSDWYALDFYYDYAPRDVDHFRILYRVKNDTLEFKCNVPKIEEIWGKMGTIYKKLDAFFREVPEFRLPLLLGSLTIELPKERVRHPEKFANLRATSEVRKQKNAIFSLRSKVQSVYARSADKKISDYTAYGVPVIFTAGEPGLHLARLLRDIGAAKEASVGSYERNQTIDMQFFGQKLEGRLSLAQYQMFEAFVDGLNELGFCVWTR